MCNFEILVEGYIEGNMNILKDFLQTNHINPNIQNNDLTMASRRKLFQRREGDSGTAFFRGFLRHLHVICRTAPSY